MPGGITAYPIVRASARQKPGFARKLAIALLSAVLFFAVFYRARLGVFSDDFTGGILASLVVIGGTVLLATYSLLRGRVPRSPLLVSALAFFLIASTTPLASALILGADPSFAMRLSTEFLLCGAFFLVAYLPIMFGLVSPMSVALIIAGAGLAAGYSTVSIYFEGHQTIRRLDMFGGRNYIASAYAAAAVAWAYLAAVSYQRGHLPWLVACVAAAAFCVAVCVLSGSRQSLLAVAVGGALLSFATLGTIRSLIMTSVIGALTLFALHLAVQQIDATLLAQRFAADALSHAFGARAAIYATSLSGLSFLDLLIGRPDLYEVWAPHSIHPHNIILSLIRHTGIIATLAFCIAVAWVILRGGALLVRAKDRSVLAFALSLLLVGVIYVMISGNSTRSFNFFLYWGVAAAIADQAYRNSKHNTQRQAPRWTKTRSSYPSGYASS